MERYLVQNLNEMAHNKHQGKTLHTGTGKVYNKTWKKSKRKTHKPRIMQTLTKESSTSKVMLCGLEKGVLICGE